MIACLATSSLLVEGPRGIGKSRVATNLDEDPPAGVAVLRIDLQGVTTAHGLMTRMSEHVNLRRSRIEDALSRLLGGWRKEDPWDSLEALLTTRAREPTWVLLDEVQLWIDHVARTDVARARVDLIRIDRLRRLAGIRLALAASIALRAVARAVDVELSADWVPLVVPPLGHGDGQTLFVHDCPQVVADATASSAQALAGGYPRWIKLLAQHTIGPTDRPLDLAELEAAAETVLAGDPFGHDLGHLARYPEAKALRRALDLAAQAGATRTSILTGLQADGLTRRGAEDVLRTLRRDHYLDDECGFTLPLFARWLRSRS